MHGKRGALKRPALPTYMYMLVHQKTSGAEIDSIYVLHPADDN